MALDKFEYVLAIAEERNITRAAKKLFVSQPALTVYINKLEEELGIKLFNRTINPIEITEAGELYVTEMRKIKDSQDHLFQELRRLTQEKRHQLVIGIGKSRGSCWLPYVVPLYESANPDVVLKVIEETEKNIEVGVLNGTIDIGIGALPVLSANIAYDVICEEQFVIAIPKSSPIISNLIHDNNAFNNPLLINGSILNNQKFICPSPGYGMYRCLKRLFDTYGITPGETLTINNSETAFRMAATGIGNIFTTVSLGKNFPDVAKDLFFCTLSQPNFSRSVVALYKKNQDINPAAKSFINCLMSMPMEDLGLI